MKRIAVFRGRTAVATTALVLASVVAASAQTTVITTQPATTGAAVVTTTRPIELTPVQRHTIYSTISRERVAPAQATVEYRVGTRVPEQAQLYAVPQQVAVEVPAIRSYKYMMVNGRVLLVDPATSEVVAEVAD
ncbi:MAG: DUF1236 domain-containing protein [Pseudolabrys sp.]|jgi:hypothetical protein